MMLITQYIKTYILYYMYTDKYINISIRYMLNCRCNAEELLVLEILLVPQCSWHDAGGWGRG